MEVLVAPHFFSLFKFIQVSFCLNVHMPFCANAYTAQDTPTIQNAITAELHFTKYLLKFLLLKL